MDHVEGRSNFDEHRWSCQRRSRPKVSHWDSGEVIAVIDSPEHGGGRLASQRVSESSDAGSVRHAASRRTISIEHDEAHGMKGNGYVFTFRPISGRLGRGLATREMRVSH